MVRFTASPAEEGQNKKDNRCRKITKKAKLNNDIDPSISWYTPRERKHIQHSIVLAVKRKESCGLPLHTTHTVSCSSTSSSSLSSTIKEEDKDDHRSLDRHSIRNRKR
jgi:hypothetical protein